MTTTTVLRPRARELAGDARRRWFGAGTQLYALVLGGVAVLASGAVRGVLPARFLLDDGHIQMVMLSPIGSSDAAQGFRNIAVLYRALGLATSPDLAAMVAIGFFALAMLIAVRWGELRRMTTPGLVLLSLCYAIGLLYLACYSKEFVSLAVTIPVLLLPRSIWSELLIVAAMLGYAALFRQYWALIAVLYLFWRLVLVRLPNLFTVLLTIFGLYLLIQGAFALFLHQDLTYFRTAVNDTRANANTDVASLITDFLPSQGVLAGPNAVLMLFSLLLPWPLLLTGSVSHLFSAVVLMLLWGLVIYRVRGLQHDHRARRTGLDHTGLDQTGPATDDYSGARATRIARSVALLVSMVIVQAIFEPDYGSYLKHLSPLLPAFFALVPLRPTVPGDAIDHPHRAPGPRLPVVTLTSVRNHPEVTS